MGVQLILAVLELSHSEDVKQVNSVTLLLRQKPVNSSVYISDGYSTENIYSSTSTVTLKNITHLKINNNIIGKVTQVKMKVTQCTSSINCNEIL